MSDPISEYLRWKQQGQNLRSNAKQAIEQRFRELLTEAAHLAEEYKSDFGKALVPPPVITSFRYKAGPKRPAAKKTAAPAVKVDPKIAALAKKLAGAKAKLEAAKVAGTPTKNLEDKVYELEDDLRLAQSA
ncbi:MAG: hypothetical protein K2X03_24025 [Bryobacteraceae bacterium]|nr:hypothetical protein [Bryobacteraceae bacterium]